VDLSGGRLDLDTSGLLLMTNDSELAEHITSPEHHVAKTYLVKTSILLNDEQLMRLRNGMELKDGPTRPAQYGGFAIPRSTPSSRSRSPKDATGRCGA